MAPGKGAAQAPTKYRQLMKILHPDKRSESAEALAGGREACSQAFERVQSASEQSKGKDPSVWTPPPQPMAEAQQQPAPPSGTAMPWCLPLLRNYSYVPIELKPFDTMEFTPWSATTGRARKTFITDSTIMHRMCSLAGVPEGWVNVDIHIDGYLVARVLGKNAGCFAGAGDAMHEKFSRV